HGRDDLAAFGHLHRLADADHRADVVLLRPSGGVLTDHTRVIVAITVVLLFVSEQRPQPARYDRTDPTDECDEQQRQDEETDEYGRADRPATNACELLYQLTPPDGRNVAG